MGGIGARRGGRRASGGSRWGGGEGGRGWGGISGWLVVYGAASMVNMSFDVYLQGPHGGIWFWSVFGLGIAVAAAVDRLQAAGPDPA